MNLLPVELIEIFLQNQLSVFQQQNALDTFVSLIRNLLHHLSDQRDVEPCLLQRSHLYPILQVGWRRRFEFKWSIPDRSPSKPHRLRTLRVRYSTKEIRRLLLVESVTRDSPGFRLLEHHS